MATITLKQQSSHNANSVHTMTANTPAGAVLLTGLAGGGISFTCTNPFANISNATSVDITYDATVKAPLHEHLSVSSVLP